MKFKTILEGEQAVILDHLGQGEHIIGPRRVFLFRKRLTKLRQFTADPYEYLAVQSLTGLVTNYPGPCQLFLNPLEHEWIHVKSATKFDANHMIVVYKRMDDNSMQRRIVKGPAVFVPQAEEWLHEFQWHGPDQSEQGHMILGDNKFSQLAMVPDQFYYNVRDVRSIDDTMLTVKLMIFYELKDIITMLETTHDPIADMINAVCSDVIAFAGKLTFEQFLGHTNDLCDLKIYPQLMQRVERIGYKISKVVYRGYHASPQLQALQDNAIESRTNMRLQSELQEQTAKLTAFRLQKEQDRTKMRQDMERSKVEHKHVVEKQQQEHNLEMKRLLHENDLEMADLETKSKLETQKAGHDLHVEHLQQLRKLDIDLTEYLTHQQPPPVHQEICVETEKLASRF